MTRQLQKKNIVGHPTCPSPGQVGRVFLCGAARDRQRVSTSLPPELVRQLRPDPRGLPIAAGVLVIAKYTPK